ncbi:MAG: PPC domain-containing DNA-binding protein [Candidatus Hermodarchaeota archaeon]
MKSIESKIKRIIVGKVEPGEDLIDTIIKIVNKHNITAGLINCIGALKKFTIGYFDIESKKYLTKTIDEYVELISCMGNITFRNGEPIIHLHISIGTRDYNVIGGHLLQPSIVSVTGELYIFEIEKKIERINDPQFNLSLLDLE